jgi:hypothetical protein
MLILSLGKVDQALRPFSRSSQRCSGDVASPGNRQPMPITAIGIHASSLVFSISFLWYSLYSLNFMGLELVSAQNVDAVYS